MVVVTDADTGPGAPIPLATLPNLRDLGGWRTTDGREVAYGAVFRSTDLSKLSEPDRSALETLGVATVYDFRSVAERSTEPDVALDGAQHVALDVLAEQLRPVLGVDRAYLDRAFAAVDQEYGTIAGYFADGLGIDEQAQDELRDRYLTVTPPAGS